MTKISVVINTLNEEKNLPQALASAKKVADEIVVVDMKSDDETVKIAKKAGAKVYEYKRVGYVEPARNFAIGKATGKWILILDADEQIPASLAKKIKELVKKPKANYYRLPRKNLIFGKWLIHSRWWPDYNIRFFEKGSVSWSEIIHAVPMTKGKGIDLPAKEGLALIHNHYESIDQYIERMNRYTTFQAKGLIKDGYEFSWQDILVKPSSELLSRYFAGEGYRDGFHGLAVALLQAFSEIVLCLKVWQEGKFKDQEVSIDKVVKTMKKQESDLHYWQADALYKSGGGVLQRVKRKFKLS